MGAQGFGEHRLLKTTGQKFLGQPGSARFHKEGPNKQAHRFLLPTNQFPELWLYNPRGNVFFSHKSFYTAGTPCARKGNNGVAPLIQVFYPGVARATNRHCLSFGALDNRRASLFPGTNPKIFFFHQGVLNHGGVYIMGRGFNPPGEKKYFFCRVFWRTPFFRAGYFSAVLLKTQQIFVVAPGAKTGGVPPQRRKTKTSFEGEQHQCGLPLVLRG